MQNGASEKGKRQCALVARGQSAFSLGYVLFCVPKENQKSTSDFDALDPRERGCSPLIIPEELSKRKKASRCAKTGCGTQRLLRCRSHPAGRGPNSSSLFPPLAAVVAVALFSRFSDLLLRSGCYLSADGKVLLKPEIFGEAVKRRRAKMRLRDLRANARISSIFAWSPLLWNR